MPYNPNLPQPSTEVDADQMRAQLHGLKDLIDAVPTISGAVIDGVTTVPAGQPPTVNVSLTSGVLHFSFQVPQGQAGQDGATGQTGAQGPPFANAVVDGVTTLNPSEAATGQTSFDGSDVHFTFGIPRGQEGASAAPITSFLVDGVNTLNPGDNATVQAAFDGASVRFTFGIPRGNDGTNGSNGTNGSDGAQGPVGPQGPPFANAVVDGVTTLNPGDNATVQTSFDGSSVRFQFGIPRGQVGNDGGTGPQGPPGEVTNAQLSSAIGGTSSNSNAVSTLDTPFTNDPPTLADLELMRAKVNELIAALRR